MKIRRLIFVLSGFLLVALLLTGCQQQQAPAWTLNEALQLIGTEQAAQLNGCIPLSDDFSAYDCYSDGTYVPNEGKIIILQREGPEKEYSRSSFDYPPDYQGEDKSLAKVWLRADLMERIPQDRRAKTADEAETIIMAETYYRKTAVYIYEAESISGMNYDEYRPLFCAFNDVRLYDCETKGGQSVCYQEYCIPDLRAFPEEDDLWLAISSLQAMTEAAQLETRAERFQAFMDGLDMLSKYRALPDSALGRLYDLCAADDTEAVIRFCTDTLWGNAQKLSELDSEYEEKFASVISRMDYDGLEALIISRNYTRSIWTDTEIIDRKAYLGKANPQDLPLLIEEVFSFLDDVEWNMADARRILMYGY